MNHHRVASDELMEMRALAMRMLRVVEERETEGRDYKPSIRPLGRQARGDVLMTDKGLAAMKQFLAGEVADYGDPGAFMLRE